MNDKYRICVLFYIVLGVAMFWQFQASAQLAVSVSQPKVTGTKAVITLKMKNMFSETIQSARGTAFLSDGQNPVISQSTKWVVGGNPKLPGLSPGATTTFNFVIPIIKLVASTNLQSKVTFNRLVLEGGKLVDPSKNIEMEK